MADEKRSIAIDLLSRNKMTAGTTAAARDLDKVGTAADAAAKATEKLGKESERADGKAEDLGDAAGGAARKIDKLDSEIKKVNQDLILLHGALADADDAAGRLDVSKGIRKSQGDLKRLTASKNALAGLLPDPEPAAKSFMTKLAGGLVSAGAGIATKAGASVGPTIGLAIGAAAAPVLVSSLGAAISAGAGAAGIGAGVALAVKGDKEIQQAGSQAGKKFVDGLTKSATTAYKAPIMASVSILSQAGDRVSKKWGEVFASTSGMLVPLVKDVVRGGETISDSLAGAAIKSAPAMAALGDSVILVSEAVGDMIDTLGDGSQGAADNLLLLVGGITDAVKISTDFLGVLNDLSNNAWMTGPLLPLLRDHYRDAANEGNAMKESTRGVADAMTDAARAATGQRDALVALADEMRAQTDPAFALLDAVDKVKAGQKEWSKATKDHGKDSEEANTAARNLAKAAIDLQSKAGGVASTFDGKLTPAMRATLRSAGLTKTQINEVEKEMRQAKKAGDQYAKNYKANVRVTGAAAARKSLYSVKDVADSIPRAVTIAMRITGVGNVSAAASAVRKNARASGGPVARGVPYLVGENGPEMVVPEAAGRVLSAAATRGAFRGAIQSPIGAPAGAGRGQMGGAYIARIELVGDEESRVWFRRMVRSMNILPDYTAAGVSA
jgi:hypothetical protein